MVLRKNKKFVYIVCLVWIFVALVNVKARVISLSYPLQQLKSPPQPEWPIVNGLRQPIWDTGTSLCPLPLFLWTHNKVVSLSGAAHLNRRSATMAMGNGDWDWTPFNDEVIKVHLLSFRHHQKSPRRETICYISSASQSFAFNLWRLFLFFFTCTWSKCIEFLTECHYNAHSKLECTGFQYQKRVAL